MANIGIKETRELTLFLLKLLSAGDHALSDGKIDFTDIGDLFAPLQLAKDGLADTNLIPAELGDLTPEEVDELTRLVQDELVLRNVNTKGLVEDVVKLAGQLGVLIAKIKRMKEVNNG